MVAAYFCLGLLTSENCAGVTPVGSITWNHRPARPAFTCTYLAGTTPAFFSTAIYRTFFINPYLNNLWVFSHHKIKHVCFIWLSVGLICEVLNQHNIGALGRSQQSPGTHCRPIAWLMIPQ